MTGPRRRHDTQVVVDASMSTYGKHESLASGVAVVAGLGRPQEAVDPRSPQGSPVQSPPRFPSYPDPTLGVVTSHNWVGQSRHRLVALGDSFTQNFQSGALQDNSWSHPTMIARALGTLNNFRYPTTIGPAGGAPLNIETMLRRFEAEFGDSIPWYESLAAIRVARNQMRAVKKGPMASLCSRNQTKSIPITCSLHSDSISANSSQRRPPRCVGG